MACMNLDADAAYLALKARDARFDGRLFVGVTSTGIYCRPICRVRTPRRENCRFFETPAQAEAAAFRPCLKCRPEVAPGPGLAWSVMDASSTLARQAAAALDQVAFDAEGDSGPTLARVAAQLGVSDRHLRRIFQAEHGVTPVQYLQTRRLLLAKHLLTDSRLSMAQVALASGFGSLRRFNAAFAERYRLNPTRLRRESRDDATPAAPEEAAIELTLGWRPPYDVAGLLRFFERRAIPGVEAIDAGELRLRRTLRAGVLSDEPAWLDVRFVPSRQQVKLRLAPALAAATGSVAQAARRWLDLDASPEVIDTALGDLPGGGLGTRLPGSLDGFELAVRAVLGQRVTVAAARTLARRLVERFGSPMATPWPALATAFPAPQAVAQAEPDRIGELGILRTQVGAIQSLARDWPELEVLAATQAPQALVQRLVQTPGLGAWTAHYIAMRWRGWPDAFPPGDVAALKAMGLPKGTRAEREAEARSQAWTPWRSYALLRLWNSLETST